MSLVAADRAKTTPDDLAVTDGRLTLTWSELDPFINRAANALLGEGLGQPPRAAVFAHNSAECALAYLALLRAGVSGVPANFHLTADELAYILEDSGARLLFVGPETADIGVQAARAAGIDRVVGWRCAGVEGVTAWEDWLAAASDAPPPETMPPLPYMHYTSGTTGRPKGTETPPSMFPREADVTGLFRALRELVEAAAPGPALLVGPNYHTGPLGSIRQLAGGRPLVVLPRFDAEQILAAVEKHRVATMVMVPTHFQRLLALPDEVRGRYDVSSLQLVPHTGAACPVDVKRAMIAWWGPVFVDAYGATEAGTTNMITSEEWLLKPGSVGKPVPPLEMVVVAEDGTRLGANAVGQLYFRDPSGRGIVYHNDPEKTAAAHIEPGVFTLGEIGYVDDDGYVFITDRSSDMIVSGGVNIYPAEIEQVLITHPAVEDVAVIGVPNPDMGEEVKALVVLRPGVGVTPAELGSYARKRLARYKQPRSIDVVDTVGRNAMGKVNKRELRRPFWPSDRTIGG
ncbi:AMP-binding protein [Novosphingobium sp. KCTC 2891]|uniref:AMP-binding protein n=1 Tax=Novosphingobium sp. KCTC 2891 TaxID=2989730 RepID=UPI0022212D42|nr:AMP-binding protein [Novosphingobium sp. KCTC 2891]MCW1382936.1 AMP-binding protein [Novosphingobium sp. KCTC 2891]